MGHQCAMAVDDQKSSLSFVEVWQSLKEVNCSDVFEKLKVSALNAAF
jgi:hypothetical protein